MTNSFFLRGYSPTALSKKLMKSLGWANAGIGALNLANSAFGATNRTGNTLSSIGSVIGSIPTPYTRIGGAVLGAAGAVVNGFTDRVNKLHQSNINSQINSIASTNSNASDYLGLQLDYNSLMNNNVDIGDLSQWGDIGIFSSGRKVKQARENARLGLETAQMTALNNLNTRGLGINQMNFNNMYLNLRPFGGPIDFGNGAIGYSFMNRYLQAKETPLFNDKITSMPNSFTAMPELPIFAYGGNMGAYGADWTNGLTYINNGGTHEQNPLEGVLIGMDLQGVPNLVEEDEVIWNDYVFSNRLKVPNKFKNQYKLGGNIVTFADAAREFGKESEERPNDPISKRGLDTFLANLAGLLEQIRVANEKRKYARGGRLGKLFDGNGNLSNLLTDLGNLIFRGIVGNPYYVQTDNVPVTQEVKYPEYLLGLPIAPMWQPLSIIGIGLNNAGLYKRDRAIQGTAPLVSPSTNSVYTPSANTNYSVIPGPSPTAVAIKSPSITPSTSQQKTKLETDAERRARVQAKAREEYLKRELERLRRFGVSTALERDNRGTKSNKRQTRDASGNYLPVATDIFENPIAPNSNINVEEAARIYQLAQEAKNEGKMFYLDLPELTVIGDQSAIKARKEKAKLELQLFVDFMNRYNAAASSQNNLRQVTYYTSESVKPTAPAAPTVSTAKTATTTATKPTVATTTTPTTPTTVPASSTVPSKSTVTAKSFNASPTTSNTPSTPKSTRSRAVGTVTPKAVALPTDPLTVALNNARSGDYSNLYDTFGFDVPAFLSNRPVPSSDVLKADTDSFFPPIPTIDSELLLSRAGVSLPEVQNNGTIGGITSEAVADLQSDNPFTDWLRYSPVVGSALGLMLNLASRPDYSNANMILAAALRAGRPTHIGYNPIGRYLSYNPTDIAYQTNLLGSLAAAANRAILQQANGNIGAAMLGLLASNFNTLNALGEAYRNATQLNMALRLAVEGFNRTTDQTNAEMGLKVNAANLLADTAGNNAYMSGIALAALMRQAADLARSLGISGNFTGVFQGLGDIGKEQKMWQMIEHNPYILYTPMGYYKGAVNAANGGYLTIKKKKKGGRR